jgi:hypothetical protein
MNDLRKAAEALISHWEAGEYKNCTGYMAGHIRVLWEAVAHEALDRMVAENQRLGLYDDDLQTAIKKGTKAWADVPNATEWAEELRGYDTPEVTPDVDNAKLDTIAGVLHKEWVGLTDEEIKTIIFADDTELGVKTYSASDWWKIKRAEILLREKNVPQP